MSAHLGGVRCPVGGSRGARLAWAGLMVAGVACSDVGPAAGPDTLTASLESPNGAEGAAVLVLTGDGVGATTPVGETLLYRSDAGGATRLVLIDLDGGLLEFQVELADASALPAVHIEEVAGPDDELRTDLAAYRLVIGP